MLKLTSKQAKQQHVRTDNYLHSGNMDYNNPYRVGTACSGCTGSCSGGLCGKILPYTSV